MEENFSRYELTSCRLFSFLSALFTRLELGTNDFNWNLVRFLVRDGFYVRSSDKLTNFQVICFACHTVVFNSLKEFMHAVLNAYYDCSLSETDRRLGCLPIGSTFYRLSHEKHCDRRAKSVDNLGNYLDVLFVRGYCRQICENNRLHGGGGGGGSCSSNGDYICRVCLRNVVDVACLPCGHVYSCFDCLVEYLRGEYVCTPVNCFVCRTPVQAIQQLYFA